MKAGYKYILLFTIFISVSSFSQIYSDQHYVLRIDSIFNNIEENIGLKLSADAKSIMPVSYTHLRAHETVLDIVCRLLLEKKKKYITLYDFTI